MRNLDSEEAWKRFINSLAPASRDRYHRLSIRFSGTEPSLDDVLQMPELKSTVMRSIDGNAEALTAVVDSMIASIFYFELDDNMPKFDRGGFACSGYIICRLNIPLKNRHLLYDRLVQTSSWFLIQGNPLRCVLSTPKGLPPFKRRVKFCVKSLDETIAFSIRGITSTSKLISGFPTSLRKLVADQRLESPFGTIDHWVNEKPLPALPMKRNSSSQYQQNRQIPKRTHL
jgi:hypothetical protein